MSGVTVVRCPHCGKELGPLDRAWIDSMAPWYAECAECTYLLALGIYTIDQYNQWLRDGRSPRLRYEQ